MIEQCIKTIEAILMRKLTGEELIIVGLAYQRGLNDSQKVRDDAEKAKRENTSEGEEEAGPQST